MALLFLQDYQARHPKPIAQDEFVDLKAIKSAIQGKYHVRRQPIQSAPLKFLSVAIL